MLLLHPLVVTTLCLCLCSWCLPPVPTDSQGVVITQAQLVNPSTESDGQIPVAEIYPSSEMAAMTSTQQPLPRAESLPPAIAAPVVV